MRKIERSVWRRKGKITVSVSDLDADLPDEYVLATIDLTRISEAHKGRVLSFDRGHCGHHTELPPGSECHCHKDGAAPTAPSCCDFQPILSEFSQGCLSYWISAGCDYLALYAVVEEAAILTALREAEEK